MLEKCLSSLIDQTKKTDIFVSISFSTEKYKLEFAKIILNKYYKNVIFLFSKERLYQMEHLMQLTKKYAEKYDMIMFCDDDDTYVNYRVDEFADAYSEALANKENLVFGGVREVVNSKDPIHAVPEYWCYGLKPGLLIEFFKRFADNEKTILLKHNFADMYLRYYLRTINGENYNFRYVTIVIDTPKYELYHYNVKNANSICETLSNRKKYDVHYDNILLGTMKCRKLSEFNKLFRKFKGAVKDEMYAIHLFCVNKLYI